ncbi:SusC/RagA family TonB-linked outer membrane protein [Albibacterium profundi]|uniref:SusC/RagA family TonB-linked outer membrane protein n=1 Tax=Albibacterium profundi TaxID=3134906 RepID=A0ABV5CCJ5_9SPHI
MMKQSMVCAISLKHYLICMMLLVPFFALAELSPHRSVQPDTLMTDTLDETGLEILKNINTIAVKGVRDSLSLSDVQTTPFVSLQQYLKGKIAGLYVQENSGEPGVNQSMMVRGLVAPVFNSRDIYNQQPIVYLNGIPLIQDHPYAYDIQKYDYNRIGPATNLLSSIDPSNISSIEVIKNPLELAKLGPMAANGAIWISTKNAQSGYRQISINSYYGMAAPESITPTNADYEDRFRQPFYGKYAGNQEALNYAAYLRDSTNSDYYGPSRWDELYYQAKPLYTVDMSLTGGSERANFRFFGSAMKNSGNADETSLSRYNASFYINMAPFEWLTISSMVNAVRMDRDRNRNMRDRYAETRYLPDLSTPLPPNKGVYGAFLNEYDKAIDDNINNIAQGYLSLNFKFNENFNYVSRMSVDYNEGIRDVFWPSTLMETNNFVSNYFGYNQRLVFSNTLTYRNDINEKESISLDLGQVWWSDTHKYNYATAYNGPSDFIKINVVEGNPGSGDYLTPQGFLVHRYTDRERLKMLSFYGSAKYKYDDLLTVSAVLRSDGSSNLTPDNRWFFSPALSTTLNLKSMIAKDSKIDALNATLSIARLGETFQTDRYAFGPQYRVDLGWSQEPTLFSYNAIAGISRPYTQGWVGYDISNPYSDQLDITLDGSFWENRLSVSATAYTNTYENMILHIPVPAEYGYTGKYASGMAVNNKGVEVLLSAQLTQKQVNWISSVNLGFNKNQLNALPEGLDEITIDNRKLKVGEPIDQFWLYENRGIYESDMDIPVNPQTGEKLSFKHIPLAGGDPQWMDLNGDYLINDEDRVFKGNMMPKLTGGWTNEIKYKNWDFGVQLFFALGHDILNAEAANQYDFINREQSNDINSIREIYSWQQRLDLTKYPIYNPWSPVVPYRIEQDLFLEDASYLKVRSATLGYELGNTPFFKNIGGSFKRLYVYATGANLLTITPFSGADPELVSLMGQYSGYGLPIPRTFIVGFKIEL